MAGPLLVLPASFVVAPDALSDFTGLLPDAVLATVYLLVGVGLGTLVLGTSLAALVAFCDFPGRRWLEWAVVLPLAMPGYVFTLFALGARDDLGLTWLPLRSAGGAVAVFTLTLYPYVYLLARNAFLSQGAELVEAARGLGLSPLRAIARVAVPIARPAILGGVALALMESLADFGSVNLLGVQTFTNAIYKVYNGAFDRDAALQLGTLLVSVTLTLLVVERASRGRARYSSEGGRRFTPIRLRGPAAVAAVAAPLALVALVVLAPVVQLTVWSVQSISDGLLAPEFGTAARNSLLLAVMSIALVVGAALVLAYGRRVSRSASAGRAVRVATIGYGLPGSVVAVAVLVPLGWIDHRLDDVAGCRPDPDRHRDQPVRGLHGALRRAGLPVGRLRPGARAALAGRGRPRPGQRPPGRAGPDPRADGLGRHGHRGPAGIHRGHARAARNPAAPPAGRRHAGRGRVAGHDRVALPRRPRCPPC